MLPLWVGHAEKDAYLLASTPIGLSCQHIRGETAGEPLFLPVPQTADFEAGTVGEQLWVAVAGNDENILLYCRVASCWQEYLLQADPSGRVSALNLVPVEGGAHLLYWNQSVTGGSLWHRFLDKDNKESQATLVSANSGNLSQAGMTAALDATGALHVAYLPAQGQRLVHCTATPPFETWGEGKIGDGERRDLCLPAFLVGAAGLYAIWLAAVPDGPGVYYGYYPANSWPVGQWRTTVKVASVEHPGRGAALAAFHGQILAFWEDGTRWWWCPVSGPPSGEPQPLLLPHPFLIRVAQAQFPMTTWSSLALGTGSPLRLLGYEDLKPESAAPGTARETITLSATTLPDTLPDQGIGLPIEEPPVAENEPPPVPENDSPASRCEALLRILEADPGSRAQSRRYRLLLREITWRLGRIMAHQKRIADRRQRLETELKKLEDEVRVIEKALAEQVARIRSKT